MRYLINSQAIACAIAALVMSTAPSLASDTQIDIALTDAGFEPAQISVPAGTPFTLRFRNRTNMAAEVESRDMRFEKLVAAGGEIVVKVRPVGAGTHEFYNEFKEDTVRGSVVAQ